MSRRLTADRMMDVIPMYEITERDGAARAGTLTIGDRKVRTPTLLLIGNDRFAVDLPQGVDLFVIGGSEDPDHPLAHSRNEMMIEGVPLLEIPAICRANRTIGGDPASRARNLVSQRSEAGIAGALYVPGTGTVSDYAQMAYCGVDIFDAVRLIQEARKGNYLTSSGPVAKKDWDKTSCFCPACRGIGRSFEDILLHNILAALEELAFIRRSITRGQLRHLVEMRIRAHPEAVSLQRILDRDHYPFFRDRLGFTGGGVVGVSSNTLHEPVVRNYREKLKGYRKPGGEVLVLLPCSARKPYSISKSHRLFRNVLGDHVGKVHEVIVTSPLGLVPREFENFHPAAGYDISVTGEWSAEEKEMVSGMLGDLLAENTYSAIINHTPYSFVSEALRSISHTPTVGEGKDEGGAPVIMDTVIKGKATSSSSLRGLNDAILEHSRGTDHPAMGPWKSAIFRNMWLFQFGKGSDAALEETKVTGKFPFFKSIGEEGQIAMMVPKANRISLTLSGAELLAGLERNRVFIEDFKPTGDIFAVGVTDTDPGIRVGDEVAVVHGNDLRGSGVASMSGEEMAGVSRGVAVKLRHRRKK